MAPRPKSLPISAPSMPKPKRRSTAALHDAGATVRPLGHPPGFGVRPLPRRFPWTPSPLTLDVEFIQHPYCIHLESVNTLHLRGRGRPLKPPRRTPRILV